MALILILETADKMMRILCWNYLIIDVREVFKLLILIWDF